MSDVTTDPKTSHDEKLQSYFERSATAVLQTFDRLDTNYVQPGVTQVTKSFTEQPVRSTFFTTFAVLSFLPLLSFVGFSIFAVGTCTFFALAAAAVVSSAAIAFVGFWLTVTLACLFFLSLLFTNAVIASYLFMRYVTLVRASGTRAGSAEWAREVRRRVRGEELEEQAKDQDAQDDVPIEVEPKAEVKELEEHDDARSDGSAVDDTTVVFGEGSPDRQFFKELDGQESPVVKKEPSAVEAVEFEQPAPAEQVMDAL